MPSVNQHRLDSPAFLLENVGPVSQARLELGALTIIAGHNNTGKTYIVYTLYGFLKCLRDVFRVHRLLARTSPLSSPERPIRQQISKQVLAREGGVIRFDPKQLKRERASLSRDLTRAFSKYELAGVFNASPKQFQGASLQIDLPDDQAERPSVQSIDLDLPAGQISLRHNDADVAVLQLTPDRILASDYMRRHVSTYLYVYTLLPELLILNPFVLSAERFGISLFYKDLDRRRNQLVAELQKMGDSGGKHRSPLSRIDEVSRYSLPVNDNIDYTRSIPEFRELRSEIAASGLDDGIRTMMGGVYESSEDDLQFVAESSDASDPRSPTTIPLHLASSSVRGLSDLYFFLRHVARRDHLLIIDEPESHLDTLNQILLARLLVRLVRAGVRVLVSTHSDYLIKELNNLIMLSSNFEKKAEVMKRRNYEEADCLDPGRIRAYIAKENTLVRCEIDKFGIDMPNFDETINSINSVANELAAWLSVKESE